MGIHFNTRIVRTGLLTCTASLTLWSGSALAQISPEDDRTDANEQSDSLVIVVTAQKREENLQNVPVNVNVVTSDILETLVIHDTADLVRVVPSLQVNSSVGGNFQLRGIGTFGFGRSAEGSVGVVVDGVVLNRLPTNAMFDLERVEVLNGPQGLLFGKNSSAGLLNIVTRQPELGQTEASFRSEIANMDVLNVQGVLNLPLGDTAALRVSANHVQFGHFVYNPFINLWNRDETDFVRARFKLEATPELTMLISGDFSRRQDNGVVNFSQPIFALNNNPDGVGLGAALLESCGIVPDKENNQVCLNDLGDPRAYVKKAYGGSLQFDYDLAGATITSITALRRNRSGSFAVSNESRTGYESDGIPTHSFDRNINPIAVNTFSQELRVATDLGGTADLVTGLYYARSSSRDTIDQGGTFGVFPDDAGIEFRRILNVDIKSETLAAFGQANLHVTDRLDFIVGGRITRDRLHDQSKRAFIDPLFDPVTGDFLGGRFYYLVGNAAFDFLEVDETIKETNFSWRLGAQYRASDDLMIYGTVTKGYKGGFVNDQIAPPADPNRPTVVLPEHPLAFELGLKSTLLGGLATFNAALFYTRVDGFQTTNYVPAPTPSQPGTFYQSNAEYVKTKGVDISINARPADGLSITAGLLYNPTSYPPGFVVPCTAVDASAPPIGTGCATTASTKRLYNAPLWKGSGVVNYETPISDGLKIASSFDVSYRSSIAFSSTPNPGLVSGPQFVFGARLGLRSEDDRWGISLYCRNCGDKRVPYYLAEQGSAGFQRGLSIDSYRMLGAAFDLKL